MDTNALSISVPDGKPVIGFIPDLPNVLVATGHEGNGLTMVIITYHYINLLYLVVLVFFSI